MAFKQVCTSLLVAVACCSVLSTASPLSYIRDTEQNNGFPFQNQNQNQGFVYLRDNGVNQPAALPVQSGPVNVVNNLGGSQILGSSQIQTISSYPGSFGSVGFVGNNGFGSNIVNNVNSVNGFNGLSAFQYPGFAQVPVSQVVSYPSVQPVAQYAVQQPAFVGGPVGYPTNNNQITNNQVAPVEVNFSNSGYNC